MMPMRKGGIGIPAMLLDYEEGMTQANKRD